MMRLALAILVLAACGPSSAEIRTAREARYTEPMSTVFDAVYEAASAEYKIISRDDHEGALLTDGKWYAADGGVEPKGAGGGQFVRDGSVHFALEIRVQGDEGDWWIEVTPRAMQHLGGSPQPRELAPDDPAMPGWAQGKIDAMYVAIHRRLAKPAPKP